MLCTRTRLERLWDGQRLKFAWNKLEVLTLDGRARPVALSWQGRQYRRGLDGRCKEILRVPGPERDFYDAVQVDPGLFNQLLRGWGERLQERFAFDCESWLSGLEVDAQEFSRIYRPISILPPDQYRSLVLQLTEGCAYNRCSFCNLYRDRPYRCKDSAEFSHHIGQVVNYFGAALPWRRGVFLGDANAAGVSTRRLREALEQVRTTFPGGPQHPLEFHRVSCFQDTFTGKLRSLEDWRALRRLGLCQVHLGVESGSSEVLRLLQKPLANQRVVELVERLQQADIEVSLIFLLGAGGKQLAELHLSETCKLLGRMNLSCRDRVYLSDLLVHSGSEYARLSLEAGLTALSRWECRQQARQLRENLGYPAPPKGTPVALYDVRQFVYV
ncbi:radical SAM protein [bacterium]|nr:radical SAM protein [bacterium]